jgi:hypothetical protein
MKVDIKEMGYEDMNRIIWLKIEFIGCYNE